MTNWVSRKLRFLFQPRLIEQELDEEMRFHLEMETAVNVRAGKDVAEARTLALRSFGGLERYKDECREARGLQFLEDLKRDLRFAMRTFARRPGVTAITVLTLALGIGATTAIYGAVYGVLLAPLPYQDPERIITVWQSDRRNAGSREELSVPNFLDLKARNQTFASLAAAEPFSFDYLAPEGAVRFRNARVTEDLFSILGTRPLLGRTFQPGDFVSGQDRVVILSHALWSRRFRSDSSVVGRTLVLDSVPQTVVGVMPLGFDLPHGEDTWSPKIFTEQEKQNRAAAYYTVVGRLRPGSSLAGAERDLNGIASQLAREYPRTNANVGVSLVPLPTQLLGGARKALLVLLGAVACVLLIACANVANLQLAAAVRRQREFAIRTAIGAGRTRLTRQLLTESLLLALLGAAGGIVLAQFGISAIRSVAPPDLPRIEQLSLGGPVLWFGLALTVVTALIFGLAPIIRATRLNLQQNLAADSSASTGGVHKRRLGSALVIAEVALALVLLVGAGLLGQSFASLLTVDRGFRSDGVSATTLQAWSYYPTRGARIGFVKEATDRLAALPGVEGAAMTSSLPLSDRIGQESSSLTVEGSQSEKDVRVAATTSRYFSTLRIPVLRGRSFGVQDDSASLPVAIVNEALARHYWPAGEAIGRRITFAFLGPPRVREIVGVVGNVRHDGLHADPPPTIFIPHAQAPTGAVHLVVSARNRNAQLGPAIKRELTAMNRAMPVSDVVTLDALLDGSLRERKFNLSLLAAFAIAALVLAAVGIYGVMSGLTSERTHEIGIRMALGADARAVLLMVLRQGIRLAAVGIVIGFGAAIVLTRLLKDMLFRVTPLDPVAFLVGMSVLLAVAAMACLIPANRAARLDAARALRQA
ncbi:MAG TPA: ABC transporter permease [Gemmatimonadaceae bacterium]|nr:ABC transporter permease [Gemmatimonadaceae bacterium]